MQIYEKNYKIKVRKKYMSLTVRLQDRHRPTSKTLQTPYLKIDVIENNLDRRTVE